MGGRKRSSGSGAGTGRKDRAAAAEITAPETVDDEDGLAVAAEAAPEGEAIARRIDVVIPPDAGPERLDSALAHRLGALPDGGLSRSRIKALILDGYVTVDGATVDDPSAKINAGVRIALTPPAPVPAAPQPEPIPLAVLHEDADLIVIDKPAGLVVHPAAGHASGTLVNALLHHCGASLSGIGGVMRPGIVHRLDKETSGVMVVAKTDRAHQALAEQFADHGRTGPLERAYWAVVWGVPRQRAGTVDEPIGRNPRDRETMAIVRGPNGREAITHWSLVETFGPPGGEPLASLLECRLETGRTHQIRVHLTQLGHPLLGDPVYGTGFKTKADKLRRLSPDAADALAALDRQALHARLLVFRHPRTRKTLRFESLPPADMTRLIEALQGLAGHTGAN